MNREIIGIGTCDHCEEPVNVIWGNCDCDDRCGKMTWVCEKCGCGMTPD